MAFLGGDILLLAFLGDMLVDLGELAFLGAAIVFFFFGAILTFEKY